jgi:signal transduction histidine kinase
MRYLEKAALAGAATGLRTTSAVAALISARAPGLPAVLTGPVAAGVAGLGITGELENDKKPSTPSRLRPVGIGSRVAFASAASAVLARGAKHPVLPAVISLRSSPRGSATTSGSQPQSASFRLPWRLPKMRWRSASRPPPLAPKEGTEMKRSNSSHSDNQPRVSGEEFRVLAEERAALRRVATLVARGAPPEEVFAAVTEEVERLLRLDTASMSRYEDDGTQTVVAISGRLRDAFPLGQRWKLGGRNVSTLVFETGRPARLNSYTDATGTLGVTLRELGVRQAFGAPIIVEGRLWGAMSGSSAAEHPLPADTEARLVSFTELVATAVANAESRAALAASRARIVAAADETRRRIERDLHDGTQQRLVSLILDLRAAEASQPSEVGAVLTRTAEALGGVLDELQELSRGIHPAILSKGGLERALPALARRSAIPVELDLRAERRLPEQVEVAAYYVVSEALTNVAKHAQASVVQVALEARDAILRVVISDDGVGGAALDRGSGLVGLSDRVEALGGTLQLTSRLGSGTTLLIQLPAEEPRGNRPARR